MKVHNDTSLNMDTGKVTALTLLDLSAAFDIIDYFVLIDRLSDWYGISCTIIIWIGSFLINRFHSIKIRNCSFVLQCSPGLCSWTATVYSVYHTTKLPYSQPHIRPLFICRWHPHYLQQTLIFPLKNLVTVSVISLGRWQTINLGLMPIKQISSL